MAAEVGKNKSTIVLAILDKLYLLEFFKTVYLETSNS